MSARPVKFTTANTTNLTLLSEQPAVFKGGSFLNTTANEYFIKLYWFVPTASASAPTVGTTVPQMTIMVPPFVEALLGLPGCVTPSFPDGVIGNTGKLYCAVTGAAGDTDTTAVAAGQGILTFLLE